MEKHALITMYEIILMSLYEIENQSVIVKNSKMTSITKIMFSDYLLTLISSAFDKSSCVDLYVPFFLARLSTAIGSHCFPSYSDWFQVNFEYEHVYFIDLEIKVHKQNHKEFFKRLRERGVGRFCTVQDK